MKAFYGVRACFCLSYGDHLSPFTYYSHINILSQGFALLAGGFAGSVVSFVAIPQGWIFFFLVTLVLFLELIRCKICYAWSWTDRRLFGHNCYGTMRPFDAQVCCVQVGVPFIFPNARRNAALRRSGSLNQVLRITSAYSQSWKQPDSSQTISPNK